MRRIIRPLLLAALAALGTSAHGDEPPATRPADPRRGEALYTGSTPFAAGGAPCLGCHGIAGHGLARAASFGPDLSSAHEELGADGLDAMLEDIVFPSMLPVYRGHAVTQDERADLVAFLGEASGAPSPALGAGYGAGIAAAMAGFLGLVLTIGRGGGRRARATSQEERP